MSPDSPRLFEVLIVDDESDVRELLTEWFAAKGLTASTVADGRAGVAELERSDGKYGLVLTDVNMPGADGFAVTKAAREANESTYVVIMTGFASLDSAIHAVRSGAHDYLTKPFTLGQIDIILQQAMSLFALKSENRRLSRAGDAGALAAIESRLASIERTLNHVHAHVSAVK
jgi:DNA-binding NtrC family response regulator